MTVKYDAEYYRKYRQRPEYKARERQRAAAKYRKTRPRWQEMKARIGCQNCSEKEPVCLEIHHTGTTPKTFGGRQGFMGNIGMSRTRLFAELEGCVVLCANCHRKVTHLGLDLSHLPIPDFATIWDEVADRTPG